MLENSEKKRAAPPVKRKRSKTGSSPRTRAKVSRKQTETFSREELNLRVELRPLSHYVPDRDNLVDQIFTILSPEDLQRMIPPTLQSYTLSEIRERVLIESKNYQDQRIRRIIEDAISNDGKPRSSVQKNTGGSQTSVIRTDREALESVVEPALKGFDTLELCPDQGEVDSLMNTEAPADATETPDPIRDSINPESVSNDGASLEKSPVNQGDKKRLEEGITSELASVGTEWVSSLAKSQLEILELEMRARAIRSLMKAQGMPVSDDDTEGPIARPATDDENTPEVIIGELEEEERIAGNTPPGYESDPVEEVVTPELKLTGEDDDDDVTIGEEAETTSPEESEPVDDERLSIGQDIDAAEFVEQPNAVVEEPEVIPSKTLDVEIMEMMDMMILKVLSDEVEAREKRERRHRRNLRKKNSKVTERDVEEGQIFDDSDTDENPIK